MKRVTGQANQGQGEEKQPVLGRRQFLNSFCRAALLAAVGSGSAIRGAVAQDTRTVRIVVPYSAGGQTDSMARLLADFLQRTLGRNVIVDNRPGAAGLVGTKYVQLADPDCDTLLFHNEGFSVLPMVNRAATYDPTKDFDAVAQVGDSPSFLMVTDSVPAKTIPEFLAYAKTVPAGLNCGNAGINSGGHISAMLLAKLGNITLNHIPYKGSADVTRALISGEIQMQVSVTTDALNPYIKEGKIRILGVASAQRTTLAPDVPPINDYLPGYDVDGWFGILTASKTPIDKREAMANGLKAALQDPLIKKRFEALYMDIRYQGPEEFAQTIAESTKRMRKIVDELQLKPT